MCLPWLRRAKDAGREHFYEHWQWAEMGMVPWVGGEGQVQVPKRGQGEGREESAWGVARVALGLREAIGRAVYKCLFAHLPVGLPVMRVPLLLRERGPGQKQGRVVVVLLGVCAAWACTARAGHLPTPVPALTTLPVSLATVPANQQNTIPAIKHPVGSAGGIYSICSSCSVICARRGALVSVVAGPSVSVACST